MNVTNFAKHETYHIYQQGSTFEIIMLLLGQWEDDKLELLLFSLVTGLQERFIKQGFLTVSKTSWLAKNKRWKYDRQFDPIERLNIRFTSPLQIDRCFSGRRNDAFLPEVDFELLLKRVLSRVKDVANTYADTPYSPPFELIGTCSSVTQHGCFSLAMNPPHAQSKENSFGIMGQTDFSGELSPFAPFLALGSLLHIGKKLSSGYGGYTIRIG
jgi:hypothetical protein